MNVLGRYFTVMRLTFLMVSLCVSGLSLASNIPGKPTNLQITRVHNLTITLTWDKPLTTAGATVDLWYTVSYMAIGDVNKQLDTETESAQFDLQANTRYTIHVKATRRDDQQIQGDWSDTLTVHSKDFVPAKPTNLRVTDVARLAVTVAWEKPLTTKTGIPDTSSLNYMIKYSNRESRTTRQIRSNKQSTLLHLVANSRYAIWVSAYKTFNSQLTGVSSNKLTLKTNESVPSMPPANVKAVSNTPSSINISWDPIPERGRNGIIQGFVVFYGEQGVPESSWSKRDVKLVYSKELTSLTTGKQYNVKVAGYTKVGGGAKSRTQLIIVGGQFITTTKTTTSQKPTTLKPTSTTKQTTKLSTKSSTLAATTVATQKPQKPSTVTSRTTVQVNTLPSVATQEPVQTIGVIFSPEPNKRTLIYSKSAKKTTTAAEVYQSTLPVALARKADKESKSGGSFKKILLIGLPAAGALLLIIVLTAVFVSRSRRKRRRQNGEIPLQQIKARRPRETSRDAVTRGASSIRYEPPQTHFTLADDSMTEGLLQQSDETECVTAGILEPNGSLQRAVTENAMLLAGHPEKCELRVDLNAEQGKFAEDRTSGLYDSIGSLRGVGCTAENDVDKRYVTHNQMAGSRDRCPLTPPAQVPPQENGHFERHIGEEAKTSSQGDIYENMQCAEHLYETLGLQNKEVPVYENTRDLRIPCDNNNVKDEGYEPIHI